MPEHLKTLVVILALAAAVFTFAKAPACAMASTAEAFERRRNLWIAITLAAFLAHNFWIYIAITTALLLFAVRREPNKLAMFFFLLFALPAIPGEVPGLGIVNYLFIINYQRVLILVVLLSAYLSLRKRQGIDRIGRSAPDMLLASYIILGVLLQMRAESFTEVLRNVFTGTFCGLFLPYYVASRALNKLQEFRDALMAFVVAAMVLGAVGAFEFAKGMTLYLPLQDALGVQWDTGSYLRRGESLRAAASTGHALVLGYVMAIATGFFLFLKRSVPNPTAWGLGLGLLVAGLIAPLSRGPWVGVAAMILVFIATGPTPGRDFGRLGLLGVVVVPVLLLSPAGEKFINLLPFVGTLEQENVSYRKLLLEVSFQVMMDNPFFGSGDFMQSPAMQVLVQGEGIIDLVNTYLVIGLSSGLAGLSLFAGFFIVVAASIFKGMRSVIDKNSELHLLGRVLLSTLLGILVIIVTVSPISVIPLLYWSVAGVGVAYVRMVALARIPGTLRPANVQRTA